MVRVKICGLMTEGDVQAAVLAGADSLGFVTEYPVSVPWNITRERARALAASVPPFVTTTAVVGGAVEEMVSIALTVRPHFLQLHGDETVEEIQAVCKALAGTGIKAIKALRIKAETGEALFHVADPADACRVLEQSGVSGIVLDSMTASKPAGTGLTLDWESLRRISERLSLPLVLAGGLNPANVRAAIEVVKPFGVDVISGIERKPGVKDPRLIREFVNAVKACR
jgi:phosphoribosylanthranilate isomerase